MALCVSPLGFPFIIPGTAFYFSSELDPLLPRIQFPVSWFAPCLEWCGSFSRLVRDGNFPHIPSTPTPFFPSFHRTLEVYLLEIMSQVQLVELREKGIVLERVNCYSLPRASILLFLSYSCYLYSMIPFLPKFVFLSINKTSFFHLLTFQCISSSNISQDVPIKYNNVKYLQHCLLCTRYDSKHFKYFESFKPQSIKAPNNRDSNKLSFTSTK